MTDAEFLEMCRLVAAPDTGGQWTDEKIDAIEQCESDPRGVVTRLYGMLAAMTQRAEQAEAALADTVITWLQCSNNMVRAKEQTLIASRQVLAAEQANTEALQNLSVRLASVLGRVTAEQRFAQPEWQMPQGMADAAGLARDRVAEWQAKAQQAQQQAESEAEYWREKRAEDRRAELVDRALDDMWTM